jgi:hypothetical protein
MVSQVLGDTALESLTPSVNTPLVYKIPDDVMHSLWGCKVILKRADRAEKKQKERWSWISGRRKFCNSIPSRFLAPLLGQHLGTRPQFERLLVRNLLLYQRYSFQILQNCGQGES